MARTFVDTNVLVYAHDASETVSQPVTRAVLERLSRHGQKIDGARIEDPFTGSVA